eukprot:Seg2197.9 transcript_id=Seg2197.9/GoldUCD/mRNA.D3Y31 product="hypothetical protein" protein_id=Seg2197.9/GoldUCD/D3Y31
MNGLRYGMKSKPSHQLTSGETVTFAKISSAQPNSKVSQETLRKRGKQVVNVLKALSRSSDEEEVKMLFKEIARQRPDLLPTCNPTKTSVADAVNLKALTRLSMNKVRDLRCCLAKLGVNFWPSERKIREREKLPRRNMLARHQ